MRKKRSDRNHIIYKVTNIVTNETYIGVTVVTGRAYLKSLHNRWIRHIYKANILMANFAISESIRIHGKESFKHEILTKVRGKKNAFQEEAKLINQHKPALNMRMQH